MMPLYWILQEEGEVLGDEDLGPSPHYLQSTWILFYDSTLAGKTQGRSGAHDWAKNMKRIAEFNTVEDFWGVVNNVPAPSKLQAGSNYHLFRSGMSKREEGSGESWGDRR